MFGRALIAGLVLIIPSACESADARTEPKKTFGHSTVEACSAINHLFVNGEDEDTVPANIKAIIDDSPIRETWATYYSALLVWMDTPATGPDADEAVQVDLDAAEKVLRNTCAKSKVKIVGSGQQYFLPDY